MDIISLALLTELSTAQQPLAVTQVYIDHMIAGRSPESSTKLLPGIEADFYLRQDNAKTPRKNIDSTCSQITQAMKERYYPGDYTHTADWIQAQIICNHSTIVEHLGPASNSFLADDDFSNLQFFIDLQKALGWHPDPYLLKTFEGAFCGDPNAFSYKYCLEDSYTDQETGEKSGVSYTISLQYSGDIDGDGLKDMIVLVMGEYIGGRSYWGRQVAITRTSPDEKLHVLELPWFMPAEGSF